MHFHVKKYGLSILVGIALCSALFVGCDDSNNEEVVAPDTTSGTLEISDLVMQPGGDASKMNFCWYSTDTTTSEVQIALESQMVGTNFPLSSAITYTGTIATSNGYISNKVTVENLNENTDYVYRVGDGTHFSDIYTLSTYDKSDYHFIYVGDPQMGSSGDITSDEEGWQATLTQALTTFPETSFILGVGDQVNSDDNEDQYAAFLRPAELSSIPFTAAVGNHDVGTLYQYHYNVPNASTKYGTTDAEGDGDYAFTYGPALFMVLNSNNTSGLSHEEFIKEVSDAYAHDDTIIWKIVVLHHSIYSSARHSDDSSIITRRSDFYPIFDKYNIDVVMMGHDHVYTRSYQMLGDEAQKNQTVNADGAVVNPTGTLYVTSNSASGSKYYDFEENDTAYRAVRWQGYEPSYSNVQMRALWIICRDS